MDHRARDAWRAARPSRDLVVDTICAAPSVSIELDPTGWVYGCCANQLYPLGRIGPERLRDLWGGERAAVLRESLARWDLSVGCGSCRWHLEHGRMDPDAAVYDGYPLHRPDPAGPASITFALSNRCNLACVMCTPELSSTLRHAAGLSPIANPYDDAFFDDLVPFLPGLSYAKFLGGEPFLIPEHHRVWDLMAEVGGPPRLQVTTNGSIWNQRVEQTLDRFAVDVTVSIDGATAATYEAIRGGGDFATVRANLERFRAACDAKGTELRLCFCLMTNNWHELPRFLAWAMELRAAVTVNVVSDAGLALHDLDLSDLELVGRTWAEQAPTGLSAGLADVWDTQVRQLRAVLDERRQGIGPAPRQAQRAPGGLLATSGLEPVPLVAAAERLATETDRLRRWAGGGPVARVELSADGTVTAVETEHRRLGLHRGLTGLGATELVAVMEAADGRPAWIIDVDVEPDRIVRAFVLSEHQPVRGDAGSVVRTVAIAGPAGVTLLVAEDRIYDRGVPVVVGRSARTADRG